MVMTWGFLERAAYHAQQQLILAGRLRRRPLSALVIAGGAVAVVAAAAVPAAANAARPATPASSVLLSPSARYDAAMDYDAATGNIVLFGGTTHRGAVLGDTWTFNGSAWTQLSPATSPRARGATAMAYDQAAGNMVMYGGQVDNGVFPVGTWIWDGTTWTQLSPSPTPPQVFSAFTAYDPAAGNIVLFGGNQSTSLVHQTWTWNGATWAQQSPARHPSAREQGAMAYDSGTHQMVLFGGAGLVAGHTACLRDTWTWDGTIWTRLSPATRPQACSGTAMAYDQATGQLVLFGGARILHSGRVQFLNQTWTWNGTTWTQQSPATSPPARDSASMTYDPAIGQVVLFGGATGNTNRTFGDTWTWNGTTWTQLSP